MEIRYLKSFVVLAQELHFGRAAQRLHIVQPALSKQMKILEEEVGCRLFNRNRRGVALSEAGRFFLVEAEQALKHVERAVETARRVGLGQLGCVRIGYSASAVHSGVLASALARIEAQMPQVEVVLEHIDPWQQTERILANEVDFVIGPKPIDAAQEGLNIQCLSELEICVALSSRHPLAANDTLSDSDLENESFIEFAESEAEGNAIVTRMLGLVPRRIIAKPDLLSVLAFVQAGRGICVLPAVLTLPAFPHVIYKHFANSPRLQVVAISRWHDDTSFLRNLGKLIAPGKE